MPNSRHDRSTSEAAMLWSCMALLVVSVLGGGGQGGLGDTCAQMLALLLLGYVGWSAARNRLNWRAGRWVRWLPLLALALPILQLLPIPLGLWTAAPARTELAAQLAAAGVSPAQVASLNPGATEAALWQLLTPTALFLGVLCISRSGQRWLVAAILALALLSVLMGMAQLAAGPESGLRFYQRTNHMEAVGFFANRNHLAALLVMALPVGIAATARAASARTLEGQTPHMWILAGCGLLIMLILGIALARSRAGLLLGMLAILGSFAILVGLRNQRGTKRVLAVVIGAALMLSVQFALFGILQRVELDPFEDSRWDIAQITKEAAAAYAPIGSGVGTFRQAYQPFEVEHKPGAAIVNHAHNDYLELWLEGGVPAVMLLCLGGLAWAWRGVQLAHASDPNNTAASMSRLLSRSAWLSVTLVLLHSAFDYPLRTTANLAVFATLVAIAFSDAGRRNVS